MNALQASLLRVVRRTVESAESLTLEPGIDPKVGTVLVALGDSLLLLVDVLEGKTPRPSKRPTGALADLMDRVAADNVESVELPAEFFEATSLDEYASQARALVVELAGASENLLKGIADPGWPEAQKLRQLAKEAREWLGGPVPSEFLEP